LYGIAALVAAEEEEVRVLTPPRTTIEGALRERERVEVGAPSPPSTTAS